MFKEFKEFIQKGNVMDLAVGFIIGAAFGKIVTSLINDVIMPPIGSCWGRSTFSNLYINLSGRPFETLAEAKKAGAATINYGAFLNTLPGIRHRRPTIFIMVKWINAFRRKPVPVPAVPTTKDCPSASRPFRSRRCAAPIARRS